MLREKHFDLSVLFDYRPKIYFLPDLDPCHSKYQQIQKAKYIISNVSQNSLSLFYTTQFSDIYNNILQAKNKFVEFWYKHAS